MSMRTLASEPARERPRVPTEGRERSLGAAGLLASGRSTSSGSTMSIKGLALRFTSWMDQLMAVRRTTMRGKIMPTLFAIFFSYGLASLLVTVLVTAFLRGAGRDFYHQPVQLDLFPNSGSLAEPEARSPLSILVLARPALFALWRQLRERSPLGPPSRTRTGPHNSVGREVGVLAQQQEQT
jgi:hypothetical protein